MKIGLYLQDKNSKKCNPREFKSHMDKVAKAKLDLLVFPEQCYTPFSTQSGSLNILNENENQKLVNKCFNLSKFIRCAVIFGGSDRYGTLYSLYTNAFSSKEETTYRLYIKHTSTSYSAFDLDNYNDIIELLFKPILLKDKKIGMTICYDCNHAAFSRMYGKHNVDIIINSTGGNVVRCKWYRYNKVRAMENHCFVFCTMGYLGDYKKLNSYTFGFTPKGKIMECTPLIKPRIDDIPIGNIYIYDTSYDTKDYEVDINLMQNETTNKFEHFFIDPSDIETLFYSAKMVDNNLYVKRLKDNNVILCMLSDQDIMLPEKVLALLYHKKLKKIKNKKYIIINKWNHLDKAFFFNVLSDVLRVRSMENYCTVLLISPEYMKCYQCGNNRTSQVIANIDGKYGIDLDRTSGPETIWKNKPNISASWRTGYEMLIDKLNSNNH